MPMYSKAYEELGEPVLRMEDLREEAKGLLARPPVHDTILRVVYRAVEKIDGVKTPTVTGLVVVAGLKTREAFPLTRLDPIHFVKVYHPGARGGVVQEWERTRAIGQMLAEVKPAFFPKPLGYEQSTPYAVKAIQPKAKLKLDLAPNAQVDLYRSRVVPGLSLGALSPLGNQGTHGHYLEGKPGECARAGAASIEELRDLWQSLERAHRLLKQHHEAGVVHGDSHRHNILLVEKPVKGTVHLEPVFIDYEAAKFRDQLPPAEWRVRCEDDFDDVLREALMLQQTQLGPQKGELARHARTREEELCGQTI